VKLIILVLLSFNVCNATTFTYSNGLTLTAKTYDKAAKLCYTELTGNKYPGEEQGLKIIDICANPVQVKDEK
jgi:hypothetical protein